MITEKERFDCMVRSERLLDVILKNIANGGDFSSKDIETACNLVNLLDYLEMHCVTSDMGKAWSNG